jgi:hypothetical protein
MFNKCVPAEIGYVNELISKKSLRDRHRYRVIRKSCWCASFG